MAKAILASKKTDPQHRRAAQFMKAADVDVQKYFAITGAVI